MTLYLVACALTAPALLLALLIACAWISVREAGRRIDVLVDQALTQQCREPSCPDFGDPSFGEGTCPAEHAEPDPTIRSSCCWCGAPRRSDGTRTCSVSCVRGVDPRRHIGAEPELADGCAELGQCGRRLTGDHDDREAGGESA